MKNTLLHKIEIAPITDEASYQNACDLIERLMDLSGLDNTEEEARRIAYLDALATLVEAYEMKNFQFNRVDLTLLQVIEQALEQLNLTKKDLAKMLGSNRVTEIFSGKRDLSMAQVRLLSQQLHIPTDILIHSKRPKVPA
ncbi:MAG: helix-turn-helix domain-containing protein [Saprospiraceae bacterium]